MYNLKKHATERPYSSLLKWMALAVICGYVIVAVLFYFLAGEQLHLRQSRGNLTSQMADRVTVEMTTGSVIEQIFTVEIQRLERVGVFWGTFSRPNSGTVTVELYDTRTDTLLMSDSFDMAEITEGGLTELAVETPLEGLSQVPLLLRVTSTDGQLGSTATPLMNSQTQEDGFSLSINGDPTPGVLCFIASGTDYIWTGLHYWELVTVGLVLIIIFLGVVWYRYKKGKHSYVLNAVAAVQKYNFLIRQLVARDFKTKYKRSVLGMFWSFLNPLLTMAVQYFVFSNIFEGGIANFAVYLLIGVVMFNFFTESCGMALTSILGNASLITKVYMPKYIYPLTRVISSLINLAISLIPLLIVCLATGIEFRKSAVLALFFLACLVIFSLGVGLLLSTSMVFFRDTQFLWGVLSMMWMYATPIFYPENILPAEFQFVLQMNPLYHFLKNTRMCIMDGLSPEPAIYIQCFFIALAALLIGALVFRKNQDKFVLYL